MAKGKAFAMAVNLVLRDINGHPDPTSIVRALRATHDSTVAAGASAASLLRLRCFGAPFNVPVYAYMLTSRTRGSPEGIRGARY